MFIVLHRRIFYWITGVFVAAAVGAVAVFGLPLSIDFTGGSLTEVRYDGDRPTQETVEQALTERGFTGASVRPTGERGYIIRTRPVAADGNVAIEEAASLGGGAPLSVERFTNIGPVIGEELRSKAFVALGLVVVAIILFIAFVFRHVSEPVPSWKYGGIAIIALLHDILIPVGVFAAIAQFTAAEIDTLFVMALLAILGYSVNDTIVVFDRVRENLRQNKEAERTEEFSLTVGKSLDQTFTRSINTSLTTAVVLSMLFIIGTPATEFFALTLLAGVVAGAYSSLCLATPLLVTIEARQRRKRAATAEAAVETTNA